MSSIPSIREGAVFTAKNEETAFIAVATPSIREGALPGAAVQVTANNEETVIATVATPSIREGALPGAAVRVTVNNEETANYKVATPPIREGALPGATIEETTCEVELSIILQSKQQLNKVNQNYIVNECLQNSTCNYSTASKLLYLHFILLLVCLCTSLFSGCIVNCLLLTTLLCTTAVSVFKILDEDKYIMQVFIDCNALEKAEQLTVINCNAQLISIKNNRSRREKFIYYKDHNVGQPAHVRDREPSRIPVKRINAICRKSRKLQRLLCSYILKCVPKSSKMHNFINSRKPRAYISCNDICSLMNKLKMKSNPFSYQASIGCRRCMAKLFRNNFSPVALILHFILKP